MTCKQSLALFSLLHARRSLQCVAKQPWKRPRHVASLCWTFLSCLSVKQALCNCRKMCSLAFSPCSASLAGGKGRAEGKKREWAPLLLVFKTPRRKRWNQTSSSPFAHCKDVSQYLYWLSHRATRREEKLLLSPSLIFTSKSNPERKSKPFIFLNSHTAGSQPTAQSSLLHFLDRFVSFVFLFPLWHMLCVTVTGMKLWEPQSQHRGKEQGNSWPGNQAAAGSCCQTCLWWCRALSSSEIFLVYMKHF